MKPGEFILRSETIRCNEGKEVVEVTVLNRGDRPVQIGSHFHFFEVNPFLQFDREEARGRHLNIPAGTAVRFEPGDEKTVPLVAFSGERKVYGLNQLVNGRLDDEL
ncbi:urease subunit beta [Halobacillus kuroshimensis]|uniref:Urease subunit beta n=1 Tax=Halobacillus kuroshimensis TaxID=302481 RepID=A0ABS3DWJ5_9BACI|nr:MULTISPECIES: urease subunit beta [Halobacillus]MBN8235711.1 urease subunit beta [Halobacillus kuroshimensis]